MKTACSRRRYRERRKRRPRQRRLEKPFSERPGAMPAALSATWLIGVAMWFLAIEAAQFKIDTSRTGRDSAWVCREGYEHPLLRP